VATFAIAPRAPRMQPCSPRRFLPTTTVEYDCTRRIPVGANRCRAWANRIRVSLTFSNRIVGAGSFGRMLALAGLHWGLSASSSPSQRRCSRRRKWRHLGGADPRSLGSSGTVLAQRCSHIRLGNSFGCRSRAAREGEPAYPSTARGARNLAGIAGWKRRCFRRSIPVAASQPPSDSQG